MKSFALVSDAWVGWVVLGVSIVLLALAARYLRSEGSSKKIASRIALGLALIQLGQYLYIFGRTFFAFREEPVGKYLLPPQSQFLLKRAILELNTILIHWSIVVGLLLVWWWIGIKKTHGRFIDGRDVMLLVITAAAVGWPGWLIAYAGAFALSVVGMIVQVVLKKKTITDRLIITPYIIPAAILTLLFRAWLLDWTGLAVIRF